MFYHYSTATIIRNWSEVACSSIAKPQCQLNWCPPPLGLLKLNFDWSAIRNMGIRDRPVSAILSFLGPISLCSINKAEMDH